MTKEILNIAVALALGVSVAACGRDDTQEKVGATAIDTNKASGAVAGSAPAGGTARGPLQTGEPAAPGAPLPSGTTTGARTTPDPK